MPDVALVPINGNRPERRVAGNLDGREAALLAYEISAGVAVPHHFDMFEFNTASPDEFVAECRRLGQKLPHRCATAKEWTYDMKIRVAGINFDHMHMGDLLRMAFDHPQAEIVGICDETSGPDGNGRSAILRFPPNACSRMLTNALRKSRPDFVILCPATARHAEYVERVAPHGVHILVEKPFAASVAEADRMIAAARRHKVFLAINWPLRWYPGHCTAYRLLTEGRIGELEEVHFYDGNRGPLWHTADKIETTPTPARKRQSWFYKRAQGGGSLLDYLGYGTTLGTWYHQGRKPIEVTAVTDLPEWFGSGRAQHHDRALRLRTLEI